MLRVVRASLACGSLIVGFFVAGCAHDATVPDNSGTSNQELQTKRDGSATGDGTICSWENTSTFETCASPYVPVPTYAVGDEFKSMDGCNDCTCTEKGITCTVRACQPDTVPHACTEDAKKCPNGSYVGRSGPDCEFDPCPNAK